MTEKLRPHQLNALENLANGKILCGGVGTGKSRTAIAYFLLKECESKSLDSFADVYEMQTPKDLYIITTARKRDSGDWIKECGLFHVSSCKDDNPNGVSVQVDSWNNIIKYAGVKNAFFIFDEQRLVGSGTWVKAFLKIAKNNRWILLSATPGDKWMDYIPVFVANGYYKNPTEFKDLHVIYKPYSRYPQIKGYINTGRLHKYRDNTLVKMPMVRHTTRHVHYVATEYDEDLYKRVWRDRWDVFNDQPIESVTSLFYLCRKVTNVDESRLESILGLLKGIPRLIVFYNFDYELEILRNGLEGLVVAEWNGHKHQPVPKGSHWVYLVQYQSGAEAWNCIETDSIAFYSLNYSHRNLEQAKGRIDRLNTPFVDLHYYILRSSAPIDRDILKALRAKKDFNEKTSTLMKGTYRND